MKIFENCERALVETAQFGGLANHWWGRFVAPLAAIPLLFLGRFLYGSVSIDLFYLGLILAIFLVQTAVSVSLHILPFERSNTVVLPQVAGMAISFFYVPLTTQLLFLGFLLFSVLVAVGPKLLKYFATEEQVETLFSGTIGLYIQSLLAGVGTCLLLHVAHFLG